MCVRPIQVGKYEVPCGRCYECQSMRRSEWAFRMQYETMANPNAYFLTLTYDDDNLTEQDTRTGLHRANRKHIQDFIRELRRVHSLRYFGVHEYGSITKRNHYHLIVWLTNKDINLDLALVQKLWKFGFIEKTQLNSARIHYCTKYLNKPFRNAWKSEQDIIDDPFYTLDQKKDMLIDVFVKNNTFNFMSTRPAIGSQLLDDVDTCKYIVDTALATGNYPPVYINGRQFPLPRFYVKKLFSPAERNQIYELNLVKRREQEELKATKLDMNLGEFAEHRQISDQLKLERLTKSITNESF